MPVPKPASEAKWMSLYDEAKHNTKQLNEKLERSLKENTELKSIEKKNIQLEASLKSAEQQIEKLESKLAKSEDKYNQILRDNESLKIECTAANESNAKLLTENQNLKSKIAAVTLEVSKSENSSSK